MRDVDFINQRYRRVLIFKREIVQYKLDMVDGTKNQQKQLARILKKVLPEFRREWDDLERLANEIIQARSN